MEAKHPDGQFMEAVICKLTDASSYTVGKHKKFLQKLTIPCQNDGSKQVSNYTSFICSLR